MLIRIKPGYKRLKQLITEYGEIWRVKKFSMSTPWSEHGCYYVESIDTSHTSWVEAGFTEEIKDVT